MPQPSVSPLDHGSPLANGRIACHLSVLFIQYTPLLAPYRSDHSAPAKPLLHRFHIPETTDRQWADATSAPRCDLIHDTFFWSLTRGPVGVVQFPILRPLSSEKGEFPTGRVRSSQDFAVGPLIATRYRLMSWSLLAG